MGGFNINTKISKIILFLLILSMLSPAFNIKTTKAYESQNDNWYDTDWNMRTIIVINSSQVEGDLTDFPVLINITSNNLKNYALSNGSDILFTNSTGQKLNHEIENYNAGMGRIIAWVNVTSLSSSSDTPIFMYFNNSAASPQESPTNTWNGHYSAVYHMGDGAYDSTSNSRDEVSKNFISNTSSKIWNGSDFTAISNSRIRLLSGSSFTHFNSEFTIEFVAQPTTVNQEDFVWAFCYGGAVDLYSFVTCENKFNGLLYNNGYIHTDYAPQINEWAYGAYSGKKSNNQYIYANGVREDSGALSSWSEYSYVDAQHFIGTRFHVGWYKSFDGIIDEFRISSIQRSDAWIATTYNSIWNATDGGFYEVGGAIVSYPKETTTIAATTAILNGMLTGDLGQNTYCGFYISNQSNDFDTFIYRFNDYNATSLTWTNPEKMVDDIATSFSVTYPPVDGLKNETLNSNNCSNSTGYDSGTIRKVELRYYGYDDNSEMYVNLTPIFGATTGGTYATSCPDSGAWSSWQDITYDSSSPSWNWDDIKNLKVNISAGTGSDTGVVRVGAIEIRVSGNATTHVATGTYNSGDSFSVSISDITSAEYYYVRTWARNDLEINTSSNESYFISRPVSPSNFITTNHSATRIDISWKNATIPATTNHSVLIHYSTSAPVGTPVAAQWGTFGANISNNDITTIEGLSQDTTYYFVGWTYVNNSGSPSMAIFSSSFSTTSNYTEGGVYNISVRYENESISGNLPVSLANWGYHRFFIHYTNKTDEVKFWNDGTYPRHQKITEGIGTYNTNTSGYFTIETNQTVKWIEMQWNASNGSLLRCNRIIVPLTKERNITFYIRTDLPVYGETLTYDSHTDYESVSNPDGNATITTTYSLDSVISVYIYNSSIYGGWISVPNDKYNISGNQLIINNSVLDANTTTARVDYYTSSVVAGTTAIEGTIASYTYGFKDPSTFYVGASELDSYVDIYCYNSTGTRLTIHREYFSANDEVHPMLVYDKKYFIGVGASFEVIDRIGIAPTEEDTTPESILIPQTVNISYSFFDIINVDLGWMDVADGLWVHYQDTSFSTNSVTIRVYTLNDTEVYNESSTLSNINFTWINANQSTNYRIHIEVDNSEIWPTNNSINFTIYGGMKPVYDSTSLNDLIDKILGNTPLRQFDNERNPTGIAVSWSYILVGIVAFILILSFGHINAYLGMMATGSWLMVAQGLITGLPIAFVVVGGFLIAMSLIFGMGSKIT